MIQHELLEHLFIRTEKNDEYILFLKIDKSLLEQELDFSLNNKKLIISVNNGNTLSTVPLSENILFNLSNKYTLTIFTDNNGEPISEYNIPPLAVSNLQLKKVKP